MTPFRWLLWLAILLSLTTSASWAQDAPTLARLDPDGVQRLSMVGSNYRFQPDRLQVRVGVPVELEIRRSTRLTPHDLVIRDARMRLDIEVDLRREARIVRFTPEVTGRVVFYCDERLLFFPSHRDRGMWGVLEVVEE
ncbi:hypothetical protein [Halomonas ramblicola]|uniref:hypothetical protein n=1 Tax=Halomonas ramblicola TaxID=747349 RepID=UPI0025B587E1|nr:hypothetical protein [Halomonas ramblicola]MDN3520664.1 hypothetical protein [Halomonas ramblicola]